MVEVVNWLASTADALDGEKQVFMLRTLQAIGACASGNAWSCKAAMQKTARWSDHCFTAGLEQPADDVG